MIVERASLDLGKPERSQLTPTVRPHGVSRSVPSFIRGRLWPDRARRIPSSGGLRPDVSMVKTSDARQADRLRLTGESEEKSEIATRSSSCRVRNLSSRMSGRINPGSKQLYVLSAFALALWAATTRVWSCAVGTPSKPSHAAAAAQVANSSSASRPSSSL